MIAYVDLNITINTIAAMMTPKCGDVVHGIEDTALIHFKISMRLLILEKTEGTIKNRQSSDTDNIEHTRHRMK
jgi:hypothetical protein